MFKKIPVSRVVIIRQNHKLYCYWKVLILFNAHRAGTRVFGSLKVLTNEKRGGLKVAFDRSPFKLFTLRFASGRMNNTELMFQLSVSREKGVAARHYNSVIGKQL
jgi:hypothetical protein